MRRQLLAAGVAGLLFAGLARGWWIKGHEAVAAAAPAGPPHEMPPLFRAGAKAVVHASGDPDRWKNPAAKHLRAAEAPDHFLDLEDFRGQALPPDRYQAIALLARLGRRPERTGMLPYAILENYDRLSLA